MKAASLNELKKELKTLDADQLMEHMLRLIRYKKENKELLSYLLFEAQDEVAYINMIKQDMDEQFDAFQTKNFYLLKKSLRKILRYVNKSIKYSGKKQTEVALLIYFCRKMKATTNVSRGNTVMVNMYQMQLKKIAKALSTLHEDLQADFIYLMEDL